MPLRRIADKPVWPLLIAFLVWTMVTPLAVEGHAIGVSLSAFGTATVDGVLSAGEWNHAAHVDFLANRPGADGLGSIPVTLFEMNDALNLYLALKIARPSVGFATNPSFSFDNHHAGVLLEGDDLFGMSVGFFQPATFFDGFWTSQPPCLIGICGASDTAFGGTNDGAAAASADGAFTYIELSHPLNSADHTHDFSLHPGDVVGFTVDLRLFAINASDSFADTSFPTCLPCAGSFEDIVIVPEPPSLILLALGLPVVTIIWRRYRRRSV